MTPRLATTRDFDSIYKMLVMKHEEDGLAPLCEEKVKTYLGLLVNRRGGIVLVIPGPRELEASMGLIITTWWYSVEPHIERLWDFVLPHHRRSTHAKDLLCYAKAYAHGLQTPLVAESVDNETTAAKTRLTERQLKRRGSLFVEMPLAS